MARRIVVGLLLLAGLLLSDASKKGSACWFPILTDGDGVTAEGLYIYLPGIGDAANPPVVTVEARAEGKDLPSATGTPDDVTAFLPAPIRNLDHTKFGG